MKILALDLGTKTGWAYSEGGSGVWDLAPRRHESQGMRGIKFSQSLRSYTGLVDLIVYEEVARHLGTHAAHVYGGLLIVLQMFCEEQKIDYQGVPVGTIKKFATGKGNANKEAMIGAALHLMHDNGIIIEASRKVDNNEADAYCLLKYAEQQHAGANIKQEEL